MVIDEVKADIEAWLINFVEIPHPALGNWAPCPYARKARLDNKYSVRIGTSLSDPEEFENTINSTNEETLVPIDMLALSDHPGISEVVNGVHFNQGKYALALVQSLSKLHSHAQILGKKGFYTGWDEEYLQGLFTNREDPRVIRKN